MERQQHAPILLLVLIYHVFTCDVKVFFANIALISATRVSTDVEHSLAYSRTSSRMTKDYFAALRTHNEVRLGAGLITVSALGSIRS